MTYQKASDLDLVRDAMAIAYSDLNSLKDGDFLSQSDGAQISQGIQHSSLPNQNIAMKALPRGTWLDHLIPMPSSSLPTESESSCKMLENNEQERRSSSISNIDDLFEDDDMQDYESDVATEREPKTVLAEHGETICHDADGYQMSGALRSSGAGRDNIDPLVQAPQLQQAHPSANALENRFLGTRNNHFLHSSWLNLAAPSEKEVKDRGLEFRNRLLESGHIKKLDEHSLRKTLRLVSPELTRKEQFYAGRKAKEILAPTSECIQTTDANEMDKCGPQESLSKSSKQENVTEYDEDWDWLRTEVEPMMSTSASIEAFPESKITTNDNVSNDFSTSRRINHMQQAQAYELHYLSTQLEQRRKSDQSQGSDAMEISPEDFAIPTIECSQAQLGSQSAANSLATLKVGTDLSLDSSQKPHLTSSMTQISCKGQGGNTDSGQKSYRRDHRGFEVRSALQIPSPTDVPIPCRNPIREHEIYNDRCKSSTPPACILQRSSSPMQTPGHMTPINHSPLGPSNALHPFSPLVHPSIEKDQATKSYQRDSTPAYEDRSPSPSPTSYTDTTISETEMANLSPSPLLRPTSRATSLPPKLHCPRPMPPPSPTKSRAASPYDQASPSILRSPAIARILDQSHSPYHQIQTQFPFVQRGSSPTPYHASFLSSVLQPLESSALQVTLSSGQKQTVQQSTEKNIIPTSIPPPPPIPSSTPLKLPKRTQRGRSAVKDQASKARKGRSCTVSKAKRNVTGNANITTGVRKAKSGAKARAVTMNTTGLESLDGDRTFERLNMKDEDRMDVDDANLLGRSNCGDTRINEGLRRSARLKNNKGG